MRSKRVATLIGVLALTFGTGIGVAGSAAADPVEVPCVGFDPYAVACLNVNPDNAPTLDTSNGQYIGCVRLGSDCTPVVVPIPKVVPGGKIVDGGCYVSTAGNSSDPDAICYFD